MSEPTHPGSADALHKALEAAREWIADLSQPIDYREQAVAWSKLLEQIDAALSADAALSQQGMVEKPRMFLRPDASIAEQIIYDKALENERAENDALMIAERLLKSHGYSVTFDHAGMVEMDAPTEIGWYYTNVWDDERIVPVEVIDFHGLKYGHPGTSEYIPIEKRPRWFGKVPIFMLSPASSQPQERIAGSGRAASETQITAKEIEDFSKEGGDIIFKAQQFVDDLGEPRHGFQTISMDTILVAMMLCGAEGLRQSITDNGSDAREYEIRHCSLTGELHVVEKDKVCEICDCQSRPFNVDEVNKAFDWYSKRPADIPQAQVTGEITTFSDERLSRAITSHSAVAEEGKK